MSNPLSPARLAALGTRRPWTVIAVWVALLIAGIALASQVGNALSTDAEVFEQFEAAQGDDLIAERLRADEIGREFVLVQSPSLTVDDPAFETLAAELVAELRGLEREVGTVVSFYETGDETLVSADRQTLMIPVLYSGIDLPADLAEPVVETVHAFDGREGFVVVTGGEGSIGHTFLERSESDLQTAEIFGLPAALIVLVIVFGALVAAGMPLLMAGVAIVIALGMVSLVGMQFELSVFVVNMLIMIGLATGIDYSLLVIQRFREERGHGVPVNDAIIRAGSTASRAVLFSGAAVVVALCGMFIVPDSIFRSLAVGAIAVVVVAVAASLTLLPAILRLLGDRVNRLALPFAGRSASEGDAGRFWTRTTRFVMDHAVLSVILSVGFLAAAASPLLGMSLGMNGVSAMPSDSSPYRAFAILNEEFNAGVLSPADIVIDGDANDPAVLSAVDALIARLADDADFGVPSIETSDAGNLTVVSAPIRGEAEGNLAAAALDRLRDEHIPAAFAGVDVPVYVTGETAFSVDYSSMISGYTPIVFAFVLGLSFIILLVVFRSIVVPIKAIIMNLLSVGAAYGLMVLVFQHGVGADLLGFTTTDRIETWVPLMMFTVLFGLSMDYHVFLLSRIRERFDQTHNNAESVAYGLRTTAGLITGAAAIMVVVFSGFAMGSLAMFQQMGFGLAVAVFLDATVIRTVLVPASMELLGDRNWYLPSWLHWLPRLDVEGTEAPQPALEATGGQ